MRRAASPLLSVLLPSPEALAAGRAGVGRRVELLDRDPIRPLAAAADARSDRKARGDKRQARAPVGCSAAAVRSAMARSKTPVSVTDLVVALGQPVDAKSRRRVWAALSDLIRREHAARVGTVVRTGARGPCEAGLYGLTEQGARAAQPAPACTAEAA